jgi:hypothetical protein
LNCGCGQCLVDYQHCQRQVSSICGAADEIGGDVSGIQIVGVHGIRQWDTNSYKLSADWRSALAHGITRHLGPDVPVPGLAIPYYGDVFPKTRLLQLGEPGAVPLEDLNDPQEEEFVLHALQAYASDADLPDQAPPTLGALLRVHPGIIRRVAAIDGKLGRRAGEAVVGRIREVYGYFHNSAAAEEVRSRIAEAITASGAPLVIAHSLGSVVVYDMFQREQIPLNGSGAVRALISCGSPLAWLPLQRHLNVSGKLRLPDPVSWTNIFDPNDPVTAGQGLADAAIAIEDVEVRNGSDPHAAGSYLRQTATVRSVHEVVS